MVNARKSGKCISLAGGIGLALQESSDELRGVGDEGRRMREDGRDGEDGILANVCVAMLETESRGGEQGLDELRFPQLAQEAEGIASDVLVRVLQVMQNAIAIRKQSQSTKNPPESQQVQTTYHTRIISCLSLPWASSLGQIS